MLQERHAVLKKIRRTRKNDALKGFKAKNIFKYIFVSLFAFIYLFDEYYQALIFN